MTVFLSGKHLLAWLLRSVPGCTSPRSAERVASLHSPFPLGPRARREEGGGTVLATLGPPSRKVFPEASRIPLLTSHWPVLGHMATCHSKRGWESVPLLLFWVEEIRDLKWQLDQPDGSIYHRACGRRTSHLMVLFSFNLEMRSSAQRVMELLRMITM